MPPRDVFVSTMVFNSGHSMMVNHLPKNVKHQDFSNKFFDASKASEKTIEKFGLFGSDIDYNTYFPEATEKDFNPTDSEFIEPVYRLLSNCIVSKNYNPTEFPADVLKASIPLLIGQTVNCDHETNIGNAIGSIKEAFWQESYKVGDKVIPAGINGVLKIDAKANPRIARGINMDPPSIHSNSVTVQFEWKPSHNFEHPYEFWDKLGTYDDKGEMVRRIATRIISYKETSLVSHGADPYAQKLNTEGKIINPGYADTVYNSFSEQIKEKISNPYSGLDYKSFSYCEAGIIQHNTSTIINKEDNNLKQNPNNMTELQKFILQVFGENMLSLAEGQEATAELALTSIKKLVEDSLNLKTEKDNLHTQVTELTEKVTSLQADIDANKAYVQMGKDHFSEVKNATLASYKKLAGEGKEDSNIITLIEKVDSISTLISLKATYDAQLEEKFPLHCADCGSKNINRSSSVSVQKNNDGEDTKKEISNEEIYNKFYNK